MPTGEINITYTSQIGQLKYMGTMGGLSIHESVVYVIDRQTMGFREQIGFQPFRRWEKRYCPENTVFGCQSTKVNRR